MAVVGIRWRLRARGCYSHVSVTILSGPSGQPRSQGPAPRCSQTPDDRGRRPGADAGAHRCGARLEDLRPKGAGWQLRLHEKGGKHHVMPCHHALAEALRTYIDAAGIEADRKGFLFRTSRGHTATVLSEQPMVQSDAWR